MQEEKKEIGGVAADGEAVTPTALPTSYLSDFRLTYAVPTPHKPPSVLGLNRFPPPHLVQIIPLYAYIWILGY